MIWLILVSFWLILVSFWVILSHFGAIVAIKNRVKRSILHGIFRRVFPSRRDFTGFQWFFNDFWSFLTDFGYFVMKSGKNINRVKWSILHGISHRDFPSRRDFSKKKLFSLGFFYYKLLCNCCEIFYFSLIFYHFRPIWYYFRPHLIPLLL